MPRKKVVKSVREMTTEELAQRLFPPKVLKELNRVAHAGETEPKPKRKDGHLP